MIRFERTFDYELVGDTLKHPRIYPHISDDGSPPREQYRPVESEHLWYILAFDDSKLLGLWMLHPHNSICWEIHTALLPWAWGEKALEAGLLLPYWIWQNTPCRRIITNVPAYNRLALAFAKRTGMKIWGVNRASFLRRGKTWNQICLGMSYPGFEAAEKEKECQQPQLSPL